MKKTFFLILTVFIQMASYGTPPEVPWYDFIDPFDIYLSPLGISQLKLLKQTGFKRVEVNNVLYYFKGSRLDSIIEPYKKKFHKKIFFKYDSHDRLVLKNANYYSTYDQEVISIKYDDNGNILTYTSWWATGKKKVERYNLHSINKVYESKNEIKYKDTLNNREYTYNKTVGFITKASRPYPLSFTPRTMIKDSITFDTISNTKSFYYKRQTDSCFIIGKKILFDKNKPVKTVNYDISGREKYIWVYSYDNQNTILREEKNRYGALSYSKIFIYDHNGLIGVISKIQAYYDYKNRKTRYRSFNQEFSYRARY